MKTTAEHFKYFKSRCKYWLERFSMNDFEYMYTHDDDKGNMASSALNFEARTVVVTLGVNWDGLLKPTRKELDRTAFHEVTENMLYHLELRARNRDNPSDLETERHAIVNRIWNALR